MKHVLITLMCWNIFISIISAQTTPPSVSNVVTQVSQERDKVTVTYDLARKTGVTQYNVSIRITLDGEVINAEALSGDVGPNITPGYGKRITWDVLKDVSELYGSLQVEVTAKSNAPDCIPMKTVPVYAGLSVVGASGIALLLSASKLESESQELYDVYKNNLDPNSPVFDETSREDYYQDANKKHKQAAWLSAGGITVLVAGGAIMVARLIQVNKYNKNCAGHKTSDTFIKNLNPIVRVGGIEKGAAGIVYTF